MLEKFPQVYYFTLEGRIKRQLYMENQFKKYKIKYTKILMGGERDDELLIRLKKTHSSKSSKMSLAYNCHLIKTLKYWYESTDDDYLILMEDDYDLNLIERWHFTWEQLIERLPYDWDCIQLGYECPNVIKFYLHPVQQEYSIGPSLLNRLYVEKLLNLFIVNGEYNFKGVLSNAFYLNRDSGTLDNGYFIDVFGTPDYYIAQSGNTYSIPLIPCNPFFEGSSHKGKWSPMTSFVFCYEAYYEWWNNDRDNFTLDEFFTFGKDNDILMERNIERWNSKYFDGRYFDIRKKSLNLYE